MNDGPLQIFLSLYGEKASKKLLTYVIYIPVTTFILFEWKLNEWYFMMHIWWLSLPLFLFFLMMTRDLYLIKISNESLLFNFLLFLLPSIWIIKSILSILLN